MSDSRTGIGPRSRRIPTSPLTWKNGGAFSRKGVLPSPFLEFPQRVVAPKGLHDLVVVRAHVAAFRNVDAQAVSAMNSDAIRP